MNRIIIRNNTFLIILLAFTFASLLIQIAPPVTITIGDATAEVQPTHTPTIPPTVMPTHTPPPIATPLIKYGEPIPDFTATPLPTYTPFPSPTPLPTERPANFSINFSTESALEFFFK